jgi:hypothetical protein
MKGTEDLECFFEKCLLKSVYVQLQLLCGWVDDAGKYFGESMNSK